MECYGKYEILPFDHMGISRVYQVSEIIQRVRESAYP